VGRVPPDGLVDPHLSGVDPKRGTRRRRTHTRAHPP
jgi:hypothetical protein